MDVNFFQTAERTQIFFEQFSRTSEPMDFFQTPGIEWLTAEPKKMINTIP